jgi:hypothetical protein
LWERDQAKETRGTQLALLSKTVQTNVESSQNTFTNPETGE